MAKQLTELETAAWIHEAMLRDVQATTSDAEITDLVGVYDRRCHRLGYTLAGNAVVILRAHRDKLQETVEHDAVTLNDLDAKIVEVVNRGRIRAVLSDDVFRLAIRLSRGLSSPWTMIDDRIEALIAEGRIIAHRE